MRALSYAILLGLCGAVGARAANPSVSGPFLPGMDQVDSKVLELMSTYACPGAELAITYHGRLVLARG
jgi:hypothetical protein